MTMSLDLDTVRQIAAARIQPEYLFTSAGVLLGWAHQVEDIPWEVFQGRLLDTSQTRQRRRFESWNIYLLPETQTPLLSLKLDTSERRLHVVRGVESYVHEGYDSGGGVYQTRERRKWLHELIATFDLRDFDDPEAFRAEVSAALARAVTGVRLPLGPTEAPLPAFSFGELFYADVSEGHQNPSPPAPLPETERGEQEGRASPLRFGEGPGEGSLLLVLLPLFPEPARVIEAWLRALPLADLPTCAAEFARHWVSLGRSGQDLMRSFRRLFNEVSLSPWTDFADKVLRLLALLEETGTLTAEQVIDFEGYLLQQLSRHLTAYDLVTFHHRGANYPDALLLDLVLADFLKRLESDPTRFSGEANSRRRRALRQAWMVRRHYEGHTVPDVPTSPGEHARVFPEGYPRVPEPQILQVGQRKRRLYEGDSLLSRLSPSVRAILAESLTDLEYLDERQELGSAVFLDRPFGAAKAPVEPDGTLLLASLAYSRSIAERRLRALARDLDLPRPRSVIDRLDLPGLPLSAIGPGVHQGTVSLTDAARAGPDFVFRFTLPGSVAALRAMLATAPLTGREFFDRLSGRVLLARSPHGPGLVVYDEGWQPRLELEPCLEQGYASQRGLEYPRAGFRLKRIGEG
jgi:hypothetical protein